MLQYPEKIKEVKILEDPNTILWEETRLGLLPRECYITGKMLWPYSKVAMKHLTYVAIGRVGMWSKCHFANLKEATFENLKIKE